MGTIIQKTNKDKDFYQLLGPFLAKREVEHEIGYKIYDDDDKIWLIEIENKSVLGFCYIFKKSKSHYQIGSCYVPEKYRRKGVFKRLFTHATHHVENLKEQATVTLTTKNDILKEILLREGFKISKTKGGFTEYAKEFGI